MQTSTKGNLMYRSRTAALGLAVTLALAVSACAQQTSHPAAAAAAPVKSPAAVTTHPAPAKATLPVRTTTPAAAPSATSSAAAPSATPSAEVPSATPSAAAGSAVPSAAATSSASPTPTVTDPAHPHFDTPQAAMTYLAAAWNTGNMTDLKHVTQGTARELLLGMHREATNLRLDYCKLRPGGNGDYLCHFIHDYPTWYPGKLRQGVHGSSDFIAAPSSSVGWYMYAYEHCG